MLATVHVLHPQPSVIGGYLRVGHTGHRRLEALHAAGTHAPWKASDFGRESNFNPARLIAKFAIKHGVDAVLSPSHLVETVDDAWWAVDRSLTEQLRLELDRNGGSDIAIDYQVITTSALLRDHKGRAQIISVIENLPTQNLWLKVSGFGATAMGAGTRAYIESVRDLHAMGRPLIADATGCFAGLAAVAFGAVTGISHGVCKKESFDANRWKRPASKGGGIGTRIYIPDLDRYLKEQLNIVFAMEGGKSRVGCTDTSCCPRREDQIEHSDAHMLTRRSRQLEDLSRVPELRRAEHLLLHLIDPVVRSARQIAPVVKVAKKRLIRLRDALGDLQATESVPTWSGLLTFRGGSSSINAVIGR